MRHILIEDAVSFPPALWSSHSLIVEYRELFYQGQIGRSVKLISHLNIIPRCIMGVALPPYIISASIA
jgi:hypothetical protein